MKNIIVSPFLIVIGLFEMLLLFMSINFLLIDNNGGNALGGVIALFGFIIFLVVLIIEQSILRAQKFKKENIWIVEAIILIGIFIYLYVFGFSVG